MFVAADLLWTTKLNWNWKLAYNDSYSYSCFAKVWNFVSAAPFSSNKPFVVMNYSLYDLVHVQLKSLIFYPRRSKTQGRPRSADLLINYQLPSFILFSLSEHCTAWNCNFVLSPLGEWEQKSLQLLHNMLQFNSMCERCILKHLKHLFLLNILGKINSQDWVID